MIVRSDMSVRYTLGIGDWTVHELPRNQFHQLQLERWGEPDFTVCEYLEGDDLVLPVFDYDEVVPHEPTEQQQQDALDRCKRSLQAMFGVGDELGFDYDTHVLQASRHGYSPTSQKWKISWRFVVRGIYSIRFRNIAKLIEELSSGEDLWDRSIYSSRRLLAVPGGCKGHGDHRVLEMDREQAMDFLGQAVTGEERELSGFDTTDTKSNKEAEGAPPDWGEVSQLLEEEGFTNPIYKGCRPHSISFTCDARGGDCPCCGNQHDRNNWYVQRAHLGAAGTHVVKNYSARCCRIFIGRTLDVLPVVNPPPSSSGVNPLHVCLSNIGFTDFSNYTEDLQGRQCLMVRQHLATCPACRKQHASEDYKVDPVLCECYTICNTDPSCSPRLLGFETSELQMQHHAVMSGLFDQPKKELHLARLYFQQQAGRMVSHNKVLYKFDDEKWVALDTEEATRDMQEWYDTALSRLINLLYYEMAMIKNSGAKGSIKHLESLSQKVATAKSFIADERAIGRLLMTVKRQAYKKDLPQVMDKNPMLLGVSGGVVDLQTGQFRKAVPGDYVSMSTGCPWVHTVDSEAEADMMLFLEQVYPQEEESLLMRRYVGYCLLGLHESKVWLAVTDERGGYNGKSTFLGLVEHSMGEYATVQDPCIFYKSDKVRSINDHSAGLLHLENKRLMIIEETDPSKVLAEEFIKQINGGGTPVTARQVHHAEVRKFDFITKTIMAFNQGKMPHFNVEDEAFVERMLTIPHRSRFYTAAVPDEPFSFPADTTIKRKFNRWAPYLLRWAVQGVMEYHTQGFRNVPDSCKAFKQGIVSEKDVAGDFLKSVLEEVPHACGTDFVRLLELYKEFEKENMGLQRDRRSHKSFNAFKAAAIQHLPSGQFKAKHYYRNKEDGKNTTAGSVMLGYKRKNDAI